jgi:Zn-dependent protease
MTGNAISLATIWVIPVIIAITFHEAAHGFYAKPVPVNFRALRWPRRDMVLVAAAGPLMNFALAVLAALAFHIVGYLPTTSGQWVVDNLKNALVLNVVLAVFNLFPLPPLDGPISCLRVLGHLLDVIGNFVTKVHLFQKTYRAGSHGCGCVLLLQGRCTARRFV